MSGTVAAVSSEFSSIVSELAAVIPDAEYGSATFDDYAYGSMGSGGCGDRPFTLRRQITDDISGIQTALSTTPLHCGADGPESGMEAVYQAASGAGYDQNCNGVFDSSTDVPPFLADPTDPFGGTTEAFSASSSGVGVLEFWIP